MLNQAEREALAKKMESCLNKLGQNQGDLLFQNLSPELQKEIRGFTLIGPVTSSGIEHVYAIANRLDFAIFGLRSPLFETDGKQFIRKDEDQEIVEVVEPIVALQQGMPPALRQVAQVASPKSPQPPKNELEFGPFDPRKG